MKILNIKEKIMNKNYKFQELRDRDFITYKISIILSISIGIFALIFIPLSFFSFAETRFVILTLFIVFAIIILFIVLALTIHFYPKNNIDNKNLKNIGKKDCAYIIDTGFSRYGAALFNFRHKLFYIKIFYDGKTMNIYRLKDNNAYKILKVLLDMQSYPINKIVKIPVDVYRYKNKIYVDFENLDLSKIDGFEEAKKVVENNG